MTEQNEPALMSTQFHRQVAISSTERAGYGPLGEPVPAPELPSGQAATNAAAALRNLLHTWGLDPARYGTPQWNPLGDLIPPGARVVIKPNLVHHQNRSGRGLGCLVTSAEVIDAVLEYTLLAHPREIVIADAPLQSCNFARLTRSNGVGLVVDEKATRESIARGLSALIDDDAAVPSALRDRCVDTGMRHLSYQARMGAFANAHGVMLGASA